MDLSKAGVYRYAEDDEFKILLFGYSVDRGQVKVIDLARGEKILGAIIAAIKSESVIKCAFNAACERICLSRYLDLGKGDTSKPLPSDARWSLLHFLLFPCRLRKSGKC